MAPSFSTLPTGNEAVISGPYTLFSGSFILEFLRPPPNLDASVLLKSTYKHDHPSMSLGKSHPQCPPFHLHFSQTESFIILSGRIGTTSTYACVDEVHTPTTTIKADKAHIIPPYVPHKFWPVPPNNNEAKEYAGEDAVMLVWAHPTHEPISSSPASATASARSIDMDAIFFRMLLMLVDDLTSKKRSMDLSTLASLMASQVAVDSSSVWFPRCWWLGALRWWMPWQMQKTIAGLGRLILGTREDGLMPEYMDESEWEALTGRKEM